MPKMFYAGLFFTFTLLSGTAAQAEIHKWVDSNGITHYSDKAPKTRKSKTLNYGQQVKKRTAKRKSAQPKKQLMEAEITDKTGRRKVVKAQRQSIVKTQTAPSPVTSPTRVNEPKPDLDAEQYDVRQSTKQVERKPILNVKQKLCAEKRTLLAALQETGFSSYYDEEGQYRLAWGGDGIYKGKRQYLSPAEVAKKTKAVLFEVEQYCDDPYNQKLLSDARSHWIRAEYCALNKAILEDLIHPFMRSTDHAIEEQTQKVEKLCTTLKPGEYRDDETYYPSALLPKVRLPLHLTLVEEEEVKLKVTKLTPEETLKQLLSLID